MLQQHTDFLLLKFYSKFPVSTDTRWICISHILAILTESKVYYYCYILVLKPKSTIKKSEESITYIIIYIHI